MRPEVIYGFISSVAWSLYVIILKFVSKDIPLKIIIPLIGVGVLISSVIGAIILKDGNYYISRSWKLILPIISGAVWMLGLIIVNYGIKKGYNLSVMAPIYNTNTLLVVIMSILLLNESVDVVKVIISAILVTIATIILSI